MNSQCNCAYTVNLHSMKVEKEENFPYRVVLVCVQIFERSKWIVCFKLAILIMVKSTILYFISSIFTIYLSLSPSYTHHCIGFVKQPVILTTLSINCYVKLIFFFFSKLQFPLLSIYVLNFFSPFFFDF